MPANGIHDKLDLLLCAEPSELFWFRVALLHRHYHLSVVDDVEAFTRVTCMEGGRDRDVTPPTPPTCE